MKEEKDTNFTKLNFYHEFCYIGGGANKTGDDDGDDDGDDNIHIFLCFKLEIIVHNIKISPFIHSLTDNEKVDLLLSYFGITRMDAGWYYISLLSLSLSLYVALSLHTYITGMHFRYSYLHPPLIYVDYRRCVCMCVCFVLNCSVPPFRSVLLSSIPIFFFKYDVYHPKKKKWLVIIIIIIVHCCCCCCCT